MAINMRCFITQISTDASEWQGITKMGLHGAGIPLTCAHLVRKKSQSLEYSGFFLKICELSWMHIFFHQNPRTSTGHLENKKKYLPTSHLIALRNAIMTILLIKQALADVWALCTVWFGKHKSQPGYNLAKRGLSQHPCQSLQCFHHNPVRQGYYPVFLDKELTHIKMKWWA